MKRILFIDAGVPYKKMQERFYPLWPAYLSAYVEKHFGKNKFKCQLMSLGINKQLKTFKPHLVAISSVSSNYNYAIKYAQIAKNNGIPVIIGGVHISCLPHTLTKDMDVGVVGEGGQTFIELLLYYLDYGEFRPERLCDIKGIIYYENGNLKRTPPRSTCKYLDELPHPKRSILGYHHTDTMITSRGCPYKCTFCAVTRYWDKISFASPEYVMEEINELIDNGTKIIKFYDDLFTTNKERLSAIADKIIENNFHHKVRFVCWARANTITEDVVKILKSMNMVAVEMGLESGCERSLKYLKRGSVTVRDNRRAVNLLKDAGIQANASFIIALPDETKEEIMKSYNFIKESRLDTVTVNQLVPFPGTPVWDYALKRKLVSDDMDWNQIYAIILSERLNNKEVESILKRFRRLSLIKRLKALPKSPWLTEAPKVATIKLFGKILRFGHHLTH